MKNPIALLQSKRLTVIRDKFSKLFANNTLKQTKTILFLVMALFIGQSLYAETPTHTVTVTITNTYTLGTPTLTPTPSLQELVSVKEVIAWREILYPSKIKRLKNIRAIPVPTRVPDDIIRAIVLTKPIAEVIAVKTAIVTKPTPTPLPTKVIVEVKPK